MNSATLTFPAEFQPRATIAIAWPDLKRRTVPNPKHDPCEHDVKQDVQQRVSPKMMGMFRLLDPRKVFFYGMGSLNASPKNAECESADQKDKQRNCENQKSDLHGVTTFPIRFLLDSFRC